MRVATTALRLHLRFLRQNRPCGIPIVATCSFGSFHRHRLRACHRPIPRTCPTEPDQNSIWTLPETTTLLLDSSRLKRPVAREIFVPKLSVSRWAPSVSWSVGCPWCLRRVRLAEIPRSRELVDELSDPSRSFGHCSLL